MTIRTLAKRCMAALVLATAVTATHAQPSAAGTVSPPVSADMALSGSVLATRNVADHSACHSECRRTPGCTGYSFNRAAKVNCTLLGGTLVDVAVRGAVSCRMPCEPNPRKSALPQKLPTMILGAPEVARASVPARLAPPPAVPAPAPAPPAAAPPAPPATPAPAPPAAPATPTIPAVKAQVTMPAQEHFISQGRYAEVLVWAYSAMLQNGIRLTAANPAYANVKVLDTTGFPSGSFNLVATGSLVELAGKSLTMTSGAVSATCPMAQFPAAWRCALTVPVGTIGQQQQVQITTNSTTLLNAISVE